MSGAFGPVGPMAGGIGPTGPTGGTGPTGATGSAATPHTLTITGAMVAAAGASQEIWWETATLTTSDRLAAVRSAVLSPIQFLIADPSKTVWLEVWNDNGDTVYQREIDIAHYTPDTSAVGTGALPLVVGPYGPQGATTYLVKVRTDAASLSLVSGATGEIAAEIEIVTMAAAIPISTTPVFP